MHDKIIQLIKERDEKLIAKYCQSGTFMDEKGNVVGGVCKAVPLSELLNDIHLTDNLIAQEIKK